MRPFMLNLAAGCALTAASALPALAHSSHEQPAPVHTVQAGDDGDHAHHHGAAASRIATVGDLSIGEAWARAMLPGQPAGGGYLTVTNRSSEPDRLLGASSPSAGMVELHTMAVVNDVMTMRPVEGGLEIPAGATVELKPGGYHLMLMGLKRPLAKGESFPASLTFEKAGRVTVEFRVEGIGAAADSEHSHH